jgi:threonine dehydrogenase-like Zn-dependent dehydrogenase
MQPDTFQPMVALGKELRVQFAFYYSAEEYAETLRAQADGKIDVASMVTGRVGIDGIPGAFGELADPERHAKILIRA